MKEREVGRGEGGAERERWGERERVILKQAGL